MKPKVLPSGWSREALLKARSIRRMHVHRSGRYWGFKTREIDEKGQITSVKLCGW